MHRRLAAILTLLFAAAAYAENPFFEKSKVPFQAPPFDKIKDADYQPAIEAGMTQQIKEIDAIANEKAKATFANTIVPLERSGALLTRVGKVFGALSGSNTNDVIQKVDAEESPKLAAHSDKIFMNPKLFARVKAIYDKREKLGLTSEQKYLVERYFKQFVRAGAQLSNDDQATLRKLNQEESQLTTDFRKKVLAERAASSITVDDVADLAGASESDIAAAAQAAKDKGLAGKYVIVLQNTTQQPALAYLQNRALREKIFNASIMRGRRGGENDVRAIITRLAQLRADKAKLLGYSTYAAYILDDQMAKTPENAFKLMTDIVPGATGKAHDEAAAMQKLIGDAFTLEPWDWQFYSEQVRKAQYDLDQSQVRPYFELDHVLKDGVFYAANEMYGITFKERHDIPVYNPDVRVFEVFNADGSPLALWYADYFTRANKSGGAWMDTFVDQSKLIGTKPVVFNVANFTKPAPGQPALLSFDDVTTMFHEFGHALHGMFSNVNYPLLTGTNVPRDFVEFPSQFNEHWALEPTVFAHYAKHYKTGAPMPQELVDKIKRSKTFNQGYALTEYLAAALVDMVWHTIPPGAAQPDVDAFENAALQRFNIAMKEVPPRYHSTYFSHIWSNGYAAGYYAYLWSEIIDDDAYYWFVENGGMTRKNGQRFRDMVLSKGGSEDQAAMYRAFRGRDPIVDPLLIERGLKSPTQPTSPVR